MMFLLIHEDPSLKIYTDFITWQTKFYVFLWRKLNWETVTALKTKSVIFTQLNNWKWISNLLFTLWDTLTTSTVHKKLVGGAEQSQRDFLQKTISWDGKNFKKKASGEGYKVNEWKMNSWFQPKRILLQSFIKQKQDHLWLLNLN